MTRLKLDQRLLGLSAVMERLTQARVKDCFDLNETIYIIVATGDMGKALGKGGLIIKRLQQELDQRIRIIEYRESLPDFVRSIIYPLTVEEVTEQEGLVLIKESSKKTKSLLIGREGKNLNLINRAVKRFFKVKDIKVI